MRTKKAKEWLAYGVICVVWGSTYLAIKVGLESFAPVSFAAVRYWLAAPLVALFARRAGVRFSFSVRRLWPAWGVGVLFIGLCNGMVFWAETRLESSYTALLITASPVWTALLAFLVGAWLPGEGRLGLRGWAGIALGLLGSYVLLRPQVQRAGGLVAALVVELSVVVWAAGSLWVRHLRERYHPLEMATWQMVSGASFLTLLAGVRGEHLLHGPLRPASLASLAYLVVFGSCLAFSAYFYLLRAWPAARVATSAYLNPVVAVFLGWVVLAEWPGSHGIWGGALVLLGVSLVLGETTRREGASDTA
ncbi:MAG: DMT family transporter [Thermoanaerobaculum sp.]